MKKTNKSKLVQAKRVCRNYTDVQAIVKPSLVEIDRCRKKTEQTSRVCQMGISKLLRSPVVPNNWLNDLQANSPNPNQVQSILTTNCPTTLSKSNINPVQTLLQKVRLLQQLIQHGETCLGLESRKSRHASLGGSVSASFHNPYLWSWWKNHANITTWDIFINTHIGGIKIDAAWIDESKDSEFLPSFCIAGVEISSFDFDLRCFQGWIFTPINW